MEIISFQDKKWIVKLKAKDEGFSAEKIEWFKSYRHADMVLKKDGFLFFVEEINDIPFEEIKEVK